MAFSDVSDQLPAAVKLLVSGGFGVGKTTFIGAVGFFERRGIKFVVGVNQFDGTARYDAEEIRAALRLKPHVPVMLCDVRDQRSATAVLITLVRHLLDATVP